MMKIITAPSPFDRSEADVILRSSDKEPVDFRVFKLLLSLASPFFTEIFTLPQPSNPYTYSDDATRTPVVQMAEDSDTLHILLAFCYPISVIPMPRISSLQALQKVADAALKFEMEGILNYLRQELSAPRFIEAQPLRVFAIAYRYGWDIEARKAARYTLRYLVDIPFVSELEFISGATLYRLQEYHRLCGEVASSRVLVQPALADHSDQWTWVTCKRCPAAWNLRSNGLTDCRQWWTQWIQNVADAVRQKPWGEIARNWDLLSKALLQSSSCQNCSKRAREDMETFAQMLAVEIEREVTLVELDLNFDDWSQCPSPQN